MIKLFISIEFKGIGLHWLTNPVWIICLLLYILMKNPWGKMRR